MLGFSMSTGAGTGKVLTSDVNGNGTWAVGGAGSNYWTLDVGNIGINTTNNIGIGTIAAVNKLNVLGNIGIGTFSNDPFMTKAAPNGGMIISGNVGIGTWLPSASLYVNGSTILGAGFGGGTLTATVNDSDFAGGLSVVAGGTSGSNIQSSGFGSFAYGDIIATNAQPASIVASGFGSIALGQVDLSGTITSSSTGAVAMGGVVSGSLLSSGAGSIAMGYTNAGTLQATGQGSVAIGDTVQANATDADAFGHNVINNLANSFMVGFNITPTLTVTGTNVGIGTLNPFGGSLIVASGNVGIDSLTPGQALDVQGTVRTTSFTMSGQSPISGYVLLASDSAGDTTWSPNPAGGGWSLVGTNVFTTTASTNVGIGTTTPQAQLAVAGNGVGIGTNMNDAYLTTPAPVGGMIMEGVLGIGTSLPITQLSILANNYGGLQQPIRVDGGYCNHCEPRVVLSRNGSYPQAQWFELTAQNDVNASPVAYWSKIKVMKIFISIVLVPTGPILCLPLIQIIMWASIQQRLAPRWMCKEQFVL